MTLSIHIQKSLHLNDQGVSHLRLGEYPEAIDRLSEAFRAAKVTFHEPTAFGDTQSCNIDQFVFKPQYGELENDGEEFIYQQAITIPVIPSIVQGSSSSQKILVLSSVIFNLALAHHLCGTMTTPSSSSKPHFLLKAAKLYELGFKLQGAQPAQSYFYCMAVLNNMGQVYRIVNEEGRAVACFSRLLSTLMFVLHQSRGKQNLSGVEGFLRSTFHLILKSDGAAAPAA